jgi:hypothetical protein
MFTTLTASESSELLTRLGSGVRTSLHLCDYLNWLPDRLRQPADAGTVGPEWRRVYDTARELAALQDEL